MKNMSISQHRHALKKLVFTSLLGSVLVFTSSTVIACNYTEKLSFTTEELRIADAKIAMPDVFKSVNKLTNEIISSIENIQTKQSLYQEVNRFGEQLWLDSKREFANAKKYDDRPLYWSRLVIQQHLKATEFPFELLKKEQEEVALIFEETSRGFSDLELDESDVQYKILITGFDPFLLDRNIRQSNPSGATILQLDGKVIDYNGKKAIIEGAMIPVRFADFDDGMIEKVLSPFYQSNTIDLIATISMGRKDFDLERFPARRRSATAPDNQNVFTGANATTPLIPSLKQQALEGSEFVEFSLPTSEMIKATGIYQVVDNRKISTLERGTFFASSLSDLSNQTSVQGSGGGYLSNEISYRSINLRNQLGASIPTGHIHTPRMQDFDSQTLENIIKQIEKMLTLSIDTFE